MFETTYTFPKVTFNVDMVQVEASRLADSLQMTMIQQNRIALLSFGKFASGDTYNSIKEGALVERSNILQRRQVAAGEGYKFIVSGRRAGAKMPIRLVGTGPRGGKRFEPVARMAAWFAAKGIPRNEWFPIMRAISIRGIQPHDVPGRAMEQARSTNDFDIKTASLNIARNLVTIGQ